MKDDCNIALQAKKNRNNVDHITDEECKILMGLTRDNITHLSNIAEVQKIIFSFIIPL